MYWSTCGSLSAVRSVYFLQASIKVACISVYFKYCHYYFPKVALNSTSASLSHTTLRGNPGKLFTESTTSLSSTTSADQDKSADRSADSNPSPGRVGGQQRGARLAVTTGRDKGFKNLIENLILSQFYLRSFFSTF